MTLQPAELRARIFNDLVTELHSVGRYGAFGAFQRARIVRDIEALRRSDAAGAFLLDSVLAFTDGDEARADELALKAAKLNYEWESAMVRGHHRLNAGRFSEAWGMLNPLMRYGAQDVSRVLQTALVSCQFTSISEFVDRLPSGQVLSAAANEAVDLARRGDAALRKAGVTEKQLLAVIQAAGELMRRERLLWLDRRPDINIFSIDDGPGSFDGVHVHFRLDLTAAQAARLNRELSWIAVDRHLLFPGVSASFVGSRAVSAA